MGEFDIQEKHATVTHTRTHTRICLVVLPLPVIGPLIPVNTHPRIQEIPSVLLGTTLRGN
jgi:hypothetical protein